MEAYWCFYLREYRDKIVAEMPWKFLQQAFVLKSTNLVIDRSTAISGWSVSSAVKCCIEFYSTPVHYLTSTIARQSLISHLKKEKSAFCAVILCSILFVLRVYRSAFFAFYNTFVRTVLQSTCTYSVTIGRLLWTLNTDHASYSLC